MILGSSTGLIPQYFPNALLILDRYNNLIMFLYRPSPQIPEPSVEATLICYNSAARNVALQKRMFDNRSVDVTFVFIYQISMTITTMIWCCCSEEIRKVHKKETIKAHLDTSISVLSGLAYKWPGTEAAVDVYQKLAKAALSSYDEDEKKRQITPPPLPRDTPTSQDSHSISVPRPSTGHSQSSSTTITTTTTAQERVPTRTETNKNPTGPQTTPQQQPRPLPSSTAIEKTPSPKRPHTSTSLSPSSIGQTHHVHQASPELLLEPVALQDLQQIMWNQAQHQYELQQEFDPFGWSLNNQLPPQPPGGQLPSMHIPSPLEPHTSQYTSQPSYQPHYYTTSHQQQGLLGHQQQQQQQAWRSHQEQQRELMMILEGEAQLRYEQQQQQQHQQQHHNLAGGWTKGYQ